VGHRRGRCSAPSAPRTQPHEEFGQISRREPHMPCSDSELPTNGAKARGSRKSRSRDEASAPSSAAESVLGQDPRDHVNATIAIRRSRIRCRTHPPRGDSPSGPIERRSRQTERVMGRERSSPMCRSARRRCPRCRRLPAMTERNEHPPTYEHPPTQAHTPTQRSRPRWRKRCRRPRPARTRKSRARTEHASECSPVAARHDPREASTMARR